MSKTREERLEEFKAARASVKKRRIEKPITEVPKEILHRIFKSGKFSQPRKTN